MASAVMPDGTMADDNTDLRALFHPRARLQRYLDVEAALAQAQADLALIPAEAAAAITAAAQLERLDEARIASGQASTGHLMVPLVAELSRAVGVPHDAWVHWGATTQNIQQTGDVAGLKCAVQAISLRLCEVLEALASLGERSAGLLMAGRTHWQQAVPITFGFKVAVWCDVFLRHLERLQQLRPRLLTSMTGGAAGTFASLGEAGPEVQAGVARRLGLTPMAVPARSIVDHFTEWVLWLGMLCATSASLAEEVARLMANEFGEVSEALPEGDVGSSTMPQKRNAKRCGEVVIKAAQVRHLAPLALDAMIQSHEVDGTRSAMVDAAVEQATVLGGEVLLALRALLRGLELHPDRMRRNLDLTGGMIMAEAVMLALGRVIGRQVAHELVHHAARSVSTGATSLSFLDVLAADPIVAAHLDRAALAALLDPAAHAGLSESLARTACARARAATAQERSGR